jgi:long-chain fatty acid transport protein
MSRSSQLLHVTFTLAVTTSVAHAGGFSTARFGGERGHAATNHLTAIYYNPAGLAMDAGTRIQIEGLFAYRSVDYDRDPNAISNPNTTGDEQGTPADAIAANSGKAELRNTLASPFVGIASDLGVEGLGVGFAAYVPFGGQAKWSQNAAYEDNAMYPGAVDGPQRWAAIEAEQRSMYFTLAGAYRVNDQLSFGAGFNLVANSVNLVRARNIDGTDDVVGGGVVKEGRSLVEGSNVVPAASVGAMFKPTPCSRIGISYQSQPGFGELKLDGTLTNKFGTGQVDPLPTEVRFTLPDIVRIAGEWRAFTKASLHAGFDYQRWSAYKNTCVMTKGTPGKCEVQDDGTIIPGSGTQILVNVVRNWKDTFTARAGGRYFVSDTLEVNAGITYDTSAVPDETMEPSLFDLNKVIGQVGATYTTGRLDLGLTIGHVQYFKKTTVPQPELSAPSKNPDMAGTYKAFVTYAILGVGVRL